MSITTEAEAATGLLQLGQAVTALSRADPAVLAAVRLTDAATGLDIGGREAVHKAAYMLTRVEAAIHNRHAARTVFDGYETV